MIDDKQEIQRMLLIIEEAIKENKLKFIANLICTLQREYQEVCKLCTDGEYQQSWTHKMVLDYLTFESKN